MTDGETIEVVECPFEGCGELHEVMRMGGIRIHSCPKHQMAPTFYPPELMRYRIVRLSPGSQWRRVEATAPPASRD